MDGWVSVDHLNVLQFPGLQMEVDPPGSSVKSPVLSGRRRPRSGELPTPLLQEPDISRACHRVDVMAPWRVSPKSTSRRR